MPEFLDLPCPQVTAQRSRSAAQAQTVSELRQQLTEQAEKLTAQDLVIADLASKLARLEERLRAHTGEPAEGEAADSSEQGRGEKQRKRTARVAGEATTAAKRTKKT